MNERNQFNLRVAWLVRTLVISKPPMPLVIAVSVLSLSATVRGEVVSEIPITGYWTLSAHGVSPAALAEGAQSAVGEFFEPDEYLTIAPGPAGTVVIVNGRGVSRVYETSGDPEWHACAQGLCEIRTFWRGQTLVQEIRLDQQISVFRAYRQLRASGRLVETVVLKNNGAHDRTAVWTYASDRVP